jgi:hypothetical protein
MCSDECGPLSPTLCGAPQALVDIRSLDLIHTSRSILYPKLEDHKIVHRYPPVQGLVKNVFFFSHDNPENAEADSVSKYNMFEVCQYLTLYSHDSMYVPVCPTRSQ